MISAPNFFADKPPQFVKRFVRLIRPQIIIVLDHEGLYTALKDQQDARVLHIPRTGGAAIATEEQEKQIRNLKFGSYFFDDRFMCNRDQIPINQLPIYQLVKPESSGSELTGKFTLVRVDPMTTDVTKTVLGVLSLQHKQLQNIVSSSPVVAAEGVLKSPLVSLIYFFELKGQEQSSTSTPTEAVIIRPTTLQKSYLDMVWILGDHKYQNN